MKTQIFNHKTKKKKKTPLTNILFSLFVRVDQIKFDETKKKNNPENWILVLALHSIWLLIIPRKTVQDNETSKKGDRKKKQESN